MKEIYLDYSATTMPDEKVINKFLEIARNFYANPNSSHRIGKEANAEIQKSIKIITDYFGISSEEIIFTSGASESNNMVFKGLCDNAEKRHIITTPLEHSSIYGPIGYMQNHGFKIDFVELNSDGTVNIENLESLIREDTLLISVCAVDSETGTVEPINEIGEIAKKHNVLFHVDMTQAIGKINVSLDNVDLASFSGHKIYTFKGIGGLIKKENVKLYPLINGGKSTTIFRSGTPQTELIVSLGEAFDLFIGKIDERYRYVSELNEKIKNHISKYENIVINSTSKAIPHVLNISFLGKNANDTQKFFEENNIFISTKTACASESDMSKTVFTLTGSKERAESSVRISLSYRTTNEEIERLLEVIDKYMGVSNENS